MAKELCIGTLGVKTVFKAVEGVISIVEDASQFGSTVRPVLASPLKKGDAVAIDDEFRVKKATGSDVIIGYVINNGNWTDGKEPRVAYTQAEAKTAGMLREFVIETVFKKIVTVDAKASEGIKAGDDIALKPVVEKSQSATGIIALSDQDAKNRVVIGFE